MEKSSYKILKEKYNKLFELYIRKRKQLRELGVGADEDDFLIGDEHKFKIGDTQCPKK